MSRRGFFFVDVIVAMGLLTACALLLAVGRSAAVRAARAGDDRRAAVRAAEQYLADDAGKTATTRPSTIVVNWLDTPAPPGRRWARVRTEVNGHGGELVGLMRSQP